MLSKQFMGLDQRIYAFSVLGKFLHQFTRKGVEKNDALPFNDLFFDAFTMQLKRAQEFNGWFTETNILYAFESWSNILTEENLRTWTNNYNLETKDAKTIAVVMAGNIPLVGFHDFLSVLISGHKILAKQSSSDTHFLPLIGKYLEHIEPDFKGKIEFTEEKLSNFDAAIATGSNNTARYFEYYFGKYPNIIRQNRNSVAILTGDETDEDLKNLGEDIFRYFGLGCRSVSKIFVPKDYDFNQLFKAIYDYHPIIDYKKYQHNYDYNKAVYLMSEFDLLENGFLMLKEDHNYASPIATLFYEYYDSPDALQEKLAMESDLIQCIVNNSMENAVPFGKTQQPELTDYADGIDTLAFLSSL